MQYAAERSDLLLHFISEARLSDDLKMPSSGKRMRHMEDEDVDDDGVSFLFDHRN